MSFLNNMVEAKIRFKYVSENFNMKIIATLFIMSITNKPTKAKCKRR